MQVHCWYFSGGIWCFLWSNKRIFMPFYAEIGLDSVELPKSIFSSKFYLVTRNFRLQMGECLMFGLDLESRCLAAVQAEEEKTQFLIGTHNIKMDNMVLICIIYRNFSVIRENLNYRIFIWKLLEETTKCRFFICKFYQLKINRIKTIQLCRLTVEGDYSRIASLSFTHPSGEVRAIASCPTNAALVATSSADCRFFSR